MTAFRVTPAELMSLSQQVHGTAGSIESELAGLRSRVLPISGTWTGQAQDRFQALYDEWNRSAQGLQQALAGISQLLSQAGQSYDEAERRIAGIARQRLGLGVAGDQDAVGNHHGVGTEVLDDHLARRLGHRDPAGQPLEQRLHGAVEDRQEP